MLAWILGEPARDLGRPRHRRELAAELPASGGSYVFLREAYGRAGRLISFLFLFQILFSAPLSMASGCIGFANYLTVLAPATKSHIALTAPIVCIVTTLLLLHRIEAVGKFSVLLWIGVLATLAIVIGVGLPHLKLSAFAFWQAPRLDASLGYAGLSVALIYAVYDYSATTTSATSAMVRDPERTIPRVIVISILASARST
jgi:amino acid transporter